MGRQSQAILAFFNLFKHNVIGAFHPARFHTEQNVTVMLRAKHVILVTLQQARQQARRRFKEHRSSEEVTDQLRRAQIASTRFLFDCFPSPATQTQQPVSNSVQILRCRMLFLVCSITAAMLVPGHERDKVGEVS